MSFEDDIARMRAEVDQGKEGMKEIAGILWAFFAALVEEGFEPDAALALTLAWLQAMVANGGQSE